jgi:hypothetical protein
MTDKEKYKALCNHELSIPLYIRDWWLDCVCGEKYWDVLLYINENHEIEAAWPFYKPFRGVITMPAHTQTMGIWFNPAFEDCKYSKNLERRQSIAGYFIAHLPAHTYFLQNFHYSFTDWLPFYWKGYCQTTRYNYILPSVENQDEWWDNLSGDIQRNIHKAQKKYHLEIKSNLSVELFMELNRMTYERQKKKPYHPEMLRKIIETSRLRNQGNIWGAFDGEGHLHAAVFIVYQKNCAYYVAAGSNPELRKSGAHAYVLWKAISDVMNDAPAFDFSGTMLQGVEHFFKGFGAQQVPYFVLSKGKMGVLDKILLKLQTLKLTS